MSMRSLISPIVLLSILFSIFTASFGVSAQNRDTEYENIIAIDTVDVSAADEFVQIENSIEKPLMDVKDIKNAHKYVLNYISSLEPYDIHWTGKHPKPIGKGVPYYTDDENTPIVYEWKVRCDDTKNCGSIIVATVDGVSRVMESGTYGLANYERLGTNKKSKRNKLYYYSAFDQYIESSDGKTTTVDMIDPEKQLKKSLLDRREDLKGEKEKRKEMRKNGKIRFEDNQSDLFTGGLVTSGAATVNISNNSVGTCGGPLPCYGQFTSNSYVGANNAPCYSGCGPTALAIIFGYYDKIGKFPNLVGNASVLASDTNIDITMVNTIRGYMGTQCSTTLSSDGTRGGETGFTSEGLGMQYARDRGYSMSSNGVYTAGSVASMPIIITEINAGRPVIVNYTSTSGHIMAAYGYQTNPNMVHVNFGWAGAYADKYIPVSLIAVTSTQAGAGNPIIGMRFHSVVTVPIK